MELLEDAMWLNGQLLEICLGFIALFLIVILFVGLFVLIITHYKLSLCVFVLCGFGYGCYNYIEHKRFEKAEQLSEIHKQCFANCHFENYYLDLFKLQDFHNKVIWEDSTNNGNEKVYKTSFCPNGIDDVFLGYCVEIKSSFNKIYYYSYEIDMDDYYEINENFFEENGFMEIGEDITENEDVEPQMTDQELIEAVDNANKRLKEIEENPRKVLKELEEERRRAWDKKCNHIYKKDNITIKIKLFHINEEHSSNSRCKVEVYNNEMEDLINII